MSTNTAKKKVVPKRQVTSATEWRKKSAEDLELPSGNVALVRRPGLRGLLAGGTIPDTLTPLVRAGLEGKPEEVTKKLQDATRDDPDAIVKMMDMIDAITVATVREPKVYPIPVDDDGDEIPLDDREELDSGLYVDEVDFEDKSFIFSFAVGGTRDLERFRQQTQELVGSLSSGQAVEQEAE